MMIPRAWNLSTAFIILGAFLAAYQQFRPFDILLTYSDVLFVLGGIMLLLGKGLHLRPFGTFTSAWFLFAALLLVALFASSMINGSVDRWLIVSAQYFFAYVFLSMVLVGDDNARWRTVTLAFLAGVVVMEVATFFIYHYYEGSYSALRSRFGPGFSTGSGRIGSFVGNPNYHAALISCTLPFLYYFGVKRTIPPVVFLLGLGILIAAIVFSASNTGLAAAVLVTSVFVIAGRIRITLLRAGFAAAAFGAFVLAGAPLPKAFEARVAPALATGNIEEAGTFLGRRDLMLEAWEFADKTFLIGLGVDQYKEESRHQTPVHNSFLLLWNEGGFLALVAWIGLIGVMGVSAAAALRERPIEAALGLSVLSAFVMFSLASPHMYARIWTVPMLLALGASFASRARRLPA